MTATELTGLIIAVAAILTSLAQLTVALRTHAQVQRQVIQTDGMQVELAGLNRRLGHAEGVADANAERSPEC